MLLLMLNDNDIAADTADVVIIVATRARRYWPVVEADDAAWSHTGGGFGD